MEKARRIAAVLMVVCLVLPIGSCVDQGKTDVLYPLNEGEDLMDILLVLAIHAGPLGLLFVRRFRAAASLAGVGLSGFGLYGEGVLLEIGYKPMVGWYVYGISALTYIATSLVALVKPALQRFRAGARRSGDQA